MTNDWMVWSVRVPTDPSHRRHSAHALVAYDRSLPQDEADLLLTLASYQCVSGEWLQREACGRGGIITLAGFSKLHPICNLLSEWVIYCRCRSIKEVLSWLFILFQNLKIYFKMCSFKSTCNSTLGHLSYFTIYTMQQGPGAAQIRFKPPGKGREYSFFVGMRVAPGVFGFSCVLLYRQGNRSRSPYPPLPGLLWNSSLSQSGLWPPEDQQRRSLSVGFWKTYLLNT